MNTQPPPPQPSAPETPPGNKTLSSRVAIGTVLIVCTRVIIRSLGFINTLVLARLLVPEDFGLVAIGVTVMQLLQNISDIGVSQAVVKFRNAERSKFDTLFTLSLIRGVVVMALLLIFAPFAGDIYGDSRVTWVFIGISLAPLFQSLVNPRYYEFERDLDFSKEFLAHSSNKIVSVAVSITIAVIFKSYWAIALGLVSGTFVQMIMSYALRPYMPRFSLRAFGELIGFTGWLTGVSFMAALNNKLDVLILGRFLNPTLTGAFYMGDHISMLPSTEIADPISKAIYPGLSSLQDTPARMRRAFLRGVEALGAIAMPASLGCAFVATDLVLALLGDKWLISVPVIQAFAPAFGVMAIFTAIQGYAMALGHPKLIFVREVIYFFIRTPLFIWATLEYGLLGAVYAATLGFGVHIALCLALYQRLASAPFWEPVWRIRRSIMASLAMAFYFFVLRDSLFSAVNLPLEGGGLSVLRLGLDVMMGGLFYVSAHYAVWRLENTPEGIETTFWGLAEQSLSAARARIGR